MAPFKYGMIVEGENYCPRAELARQFSKLIESGLNVVVQGERRMGKTSFVCETVKTIRSLELVYIDLYCVKTIEEFCRRVVAAVTALDRSAGFLRRTAQLIASLRPVLTLDRDTGIPQLTVDSRSANSVTSLEEVMDMLSFHASKRKLCIVFDEFQDVMDIDDGENALAILRSRIQLDTNTPYIFLGSVRHRMLDIFLNSRSPFYHGASLFDVGDIAADDFYKFLCGRFATGRRLFPRESFDAIAAAVRNTPGYIQEVCDALWQASAKGDVLSTGDIEKALAVIFAREGEHFSFAVKQLTALQVQVLTAISVRGGREIFSGDFLSAANVKSVASVKRAVTRLIDEGLVYFADGEYKVDNPFFAEWIRRR